MKGLNKGVQVGRGNCLRDLRLELHGNGAPVRRFRRPTQVNGRQAAIPLVRCERLEEGLLALRSGGFAVAGLCADAGTSLFDFEPPHRVVYVVGRETEGLSPEIRTLVDWPLAIPMQAGVESLNVAVAASLVCFQAALSPGGGRP